MKLLLDTHAFIWHADGSPQLSATAKALLANPANDLCLSTATAWEIAIKLGLGKLKLSCSYIDYMTKAISGYGFALLPITLDDCTEYSAMSFPIRDHRDPFDRLIVVHSKRHGAIIVSSDSQLDAYGVRRLW